MSLYGLIIGISIIIGINYFRKQQKTGNSFIYLTIFFSIVGARLYHVFDYWTYYSQNLSQIPATWNGGLAIYGAFIGAGLFIFTYSYINHSSFLRILDSITPILPLCQAIGRLGNFFNQEIPSWWIEALANLILFILIKKHPNQPTAKYFIGYGLIRLIYELFRNDTWTIGDIKIAQLISIGLIVIGSTLLVTKSHSQSP